VVLDHYLFVCLFYIDHYCIVYSYTSYGFWLLYCLFLYELRLLIIVLSILIRVTASDYCIVCSYTSYGFWLLYCLFLYELRLLIIVLSVLIRVTASDYCIVLYELRLLIIVLSYTSYGSWFLCYLQTFLILSSLFQNQIGTPKNKA
jgi:hypothetical protein